MILFAFSFSGRLSDILVGRLLFFSPADFNSSLPCSSAWSHDLLKPMKCERKWQDHFRVKHFIMSVFPWLEGHKGATPSLTWKTAARMVRNTCSGPVWARNTLSLVKIVGCLNYSIAWWPGHFCVLTVSTLTFWWQSWIWELAVRTLDTSFRDLEFLSSHMNPAKLVRDGTCSLFKNIARSRFCDKNEESEVI